MAARSPPPLVSAPHGPIERPTTTISTIVVKSGEEAFLTVGLLQSGEFARLRIDKMRPPLLSIGKNEVENTQLLTVHQNILKKLAMKEEECEALLARAAALPAEKENDEAVVYTAMAASLDCTWRELLRRLHLRENLLIDVNEFYRLLASHEEVSRVCISAISSLSQSQSPDGLARQIGVTVNEIVSITARAMEMGSSVMGQLRILGECSDNEGREEEIYNAMLIIEGAMLKMTSEWRHVEDTWMEERKKRIEVTESGKEGEGNEIDRELEEIGMWLTHAGRRLKAVNEEGMKIIMAEAEDQRTRLIGIISQTEDDRKLAKAGELAGGVEELLALTRASLNKGLRLRNFFVSSSNMYQQLLGMERDMVHANEAMAGELAPLARQKATSLSEEAQSILEKERLTHDERRIVVSKRKEVMDKVEEIERLAEEKRDSGRIQARENLGRGREWLVREAEPWMEKNGDMGRDTTSATQFIQRHSQFGESIVANDAAIQFAFNESARLSEEEQRSCREFEERYNRLKSLLEQRLHLGKTFRQVQEFARELEVSFDSLEQLIDQKAEHSDRGLQQMSKVFEMIEETLGQERTQGERFISSAKSHENVDVSLKTRAARETVREILVRHERRFTMMNDKWRRWNERKQSHVEASRVLEEIQMWQEETIEIIKLWEEQRATKRVHESEELTRRVDEVKRRLGGEREKMESVRKTIDDETTVRKLEQTLQRQAEIERRMQQVQNQMMEEERIVVEKRKELEATRSEVNRAIEDVQMWQEETMEIVRLWETKKEERKAEERKEIQKKCEEIKCDLVQQNEKIEKIKGEIRDESTSSRVLDTVLKQREISERIDGVKRKMSEERREDEKKMAEESHAKKTVEEIQMWQEEIVTILRLWEDYRMERSESEMKEIEKSIDAIRMDAVVQSERIETTKKTIQEEEWLSRFSSIEGKQKEIGERLEKIQRGMREKSEEKKKKRKMEEQQLLRRTVEEVEMWQDDAVEIIRLWGQKNIEEKKVEIEEVKGKTEQVNQKMQQVVKLVEDDETARRMEKITVKQNEIASQIQKEQQQIKQLLIRTLEEIEMWQNETVEIIRLWGQKRIEEKRVQIEEVKGKMEQVNQTLQQVVKLVDDEETARRMEKITVRQNEMEALIQNEQQQNKQVLKRNLEEIEMWQDETMQIIRLWGQKRIEEKRVQIEEVKGKMEQVNQRLQQVVKLVEDDETARRVEKITVRQNEIAALIQKMQQLVKEEETLVVEQVKEIIERPKITSQLHDISIEEGKRVEFVAKIQSKPEATIIWLKDGVDVEQSMDYRKTYLNGVATLTIEETFIEDSAVYTCRARNEGGEAETSGRLTVTSLRQPIEPPRIVRGLKSTSIEEGDKLFLDCVVVAQPEPQVVWFKEESTIKEDDRTRLDFKGDHCSLTVHPTTMSDSGMYTAKAKNVHGEATSLCQVKVAPKKMPPPTPPKPERPESRVAVTRPPAMQCTLTNETYQEGMKAVLQVLVTGSPRPSIQWYVNDVPITTTQRVKVTIEEDGWTRLIIDEIREDDAGLYMVVAENEIGEARTGATIHVQPRIKLTQVRQSFEEASGSEKTVIDVVPVDANRSIDEKITVEENRVETRQEIPPIQSTTIVMETKTRGSEEFKQKDENEIEVRPIPRDEINKTTTTVTTTTTSHIPVPTTTRVLREEIVQGEIGLSNTSTAPDFIRPLQKEYTFNENEEMFLEVLLVANPRPKVQWFFNDDLIPPTSQYAEISASGDSYSMRVKKSRLENAGYYRIRVQNVRGETESLCIVHIRPAALGPVPKTKQHVTVQEEFAMFEYEQRRPDYMYESRIPTLKTIESNGQPIGVTENKKVAEYLEGYDFNEKQRVGNPPHFTQTLLSTVTADGSGAKFEGIVTGWPAPEMEWMKDGVVITRTTHPHITVSNIGGRVSLNFAHCTVNDSGKYKCTSSNEWGVATSSAQLVVRPKTVAPDFINRLISEEVGEGDTLKWTVRVSGDPLPSVVWLRDGIIIPNCDEVKIIDEEEGIHSMIIHRVEMADSGQFTCLAENSAGEARSTADLVVRPEGTEPGHYFHVTKVTQEKQIKGQLSIGGRNETFAIESPMI